jgi:hypothetical protein
VSIEALHELTFMGNDMEMAGMADMVEDATP